MVGRLVLDELTVHDELLFVKFPCYIPLSLAVTFLS